MENISPEVRAMYETLKADTSEEFEKRLAEYHRTAMAAFKLLLSETASKIDDANERLDAVKQDLRADIGDLYNEIHRVIPVSDKFAAGGAAPADRSPSSYDVGQFGHRPESSHRGQGLYVPPPVRGAREQLNSCKIVRSESVGRDLNVDVSSTFPRDLPRFDGTNPRLRQTRCEDSFQIWGTYSMYWISLASAQFEGATARWLESVQRRYPRASWSEFCALLLTRFGRNQYQGLLRTLFPISQTNTLADYVERFSELLDQLSAYELAPDPLHYVTRFLDGLKPSVRVLVAIQKPSDLDTAYELALLHEELGDGSNPCNSQWVYSAGQPSRRAQAYPLPPPPVPRTNLGKPAEERKAQDPVRATDEKWSALRAFRRAKGLCFLCGEKWFKDHQCKTSVQLHIVQVMVDFMLNSQEDSSSKPDTQSGQLMLLSTAAVGSETSVQTLQLPVIIQGKHCIFLVDSGSSNSFVNTSLAPDLEGVLPLAIPARVKIANGDIMCCTHHILACQWNSAGYSFSCQLKLLPLGSYDGILGVDWLMSHSPMQVHWRQKWMQFQYQGSLITLQGDVCSAFAYTCVELSLLSDVPIVACPNPPEIQSLLEQFADVFATLSGLPPRRHYDHSIPLVPSAQPFSMRPYRLPPELKSEVEKQIAEMLASGVIQRSNSAFSSPIIVVKKDDLSWRIVVDYRQLNALAIKGKYPLPIIDELLDELAGAFWFSKQIRLAPGEEFKTAFQTHEGHYEFKVMAFGLTGAPATFQSAMNATLAPVLRKFALVFFDDILVYSKTYEEHVSHVHQVLSILRDNQWQVKSSKCAFARQEIAYLGHVISGKGVATDPGKIATIRDRPAPVNVKELRGFLGLAGYYRKFIRNYRIISKPLTNLLRKGIPFVWIQDHVVAFQTLKNSLVSAPVLALPDFNREFVVETDASDGGIGVVLMQDGHPLAFVTRALGPRNQGLSVYEKEYLAILIAIDQWRPYLQMGEFVIRMDQKSLAHLTEQRRHTPWQQKALNCLMGLQYMIIYKKGVDNRAADALSRRLHEGQQILALSMVQPLWLAQISASYQGDSYSTNIIQKLLVDSAAEPKFEFRDGVLRRQGRIWVGPDATLQAKIVQSLHDSAIGGHSGFPVTY